MSNIIAYTRSNKPIYSTAAMFRGNPGHYADLNRVLRCDLVTHVRLCCPDYTAADHQDASEAHQHAANAIEAPAPKYDPRGLGMRKWRHLQAAIGHCLAAEQPAPEQVG